MTTAYNLDWFRENFENIRVDVDRMKYLDELQITVSTLNSKDLALIASQLQLDVIFDCINTSDKEQLELAIAVLKKFLSVLNPRDVIKLYGVHLGRALEHPDVEAKKLVLNELKRSSSDKDLLSVISKEIPLLRSVIECVKNEDLSLASTAMQFFNELGKIEPGLKVLFSPPLLEQLKQTAAENDTIRYRVYEIVINISSHWPDGLLISVESNLLTNLLNELQSNDVLIQLTCLEMITKLALSDHGFQFLKENQILSYLHDQLQKADGLNSLLMPGFIKFFGNVAQIKPEEVFNGCPSVTNLIFQLHRVDDLAISKVSLETIGYIASHPTGKLTINKHYDSQMKSIMHFVGEIIALQATERKVVALNVLANILSVNLKDQTEEILEITKKWYSLVCDKPTKMILNICEMPFLELKFAGLVALLSIAEQPWGQQEINNCPGLFEYLLDRNEVSDMNCKAAKFKIVQTLIELSHPRVIFSKDTFNKLVEHFQQGVCYSQRKTEVTYEGAT